MSTNLNKPRTPSLRKVSGRRQLVDDKSSMAPLRVALRNDNNQSSSLSNVIESSEKPRSLAYQKSESADSAAAEASSSRLVLPGSMHKFEDTFPSVAKILAHLAGTCVATQDPEHDTLPERFLSLSDIFLNSVVDIAARIETSIYVDPKHAKYLLAKRIVHLLLSVFVKGTVDIEQSRTQPFDARLPYMEQAYGYAVMVNEGLASLFRIGLVVSSKNKPLPPLPQDIYSILGPGLRGPPSSILTEANRDSWVHVSSTVQAEHNRKLIKFICPKRLKKETDNKSIFSFRTLDSVAKASTTTLVNPSTHKEPSEPRPEAIYNQRSTVLFFSEKESVTIAGDLEEGTDGLKLNTKNEIEAASLPALIRVLTSKDGVRDVGLSQTLFSCFRLFTTPDEFLEELMRRFESEPIGSKGASKAAEVRQRVLAVVFSWLDQHWDVESDGVVLWKIRAFVEKCKQEDAQKYFLDKLLSKIDERDHCSEQDVSEKQLKDLIATGAARTPPVKVTKFSFPPKIPLSSDAISLFGCKNGREEFARHLTMKMSSLYRKLKPADAVAFWHKAGDRAREYDQFKHVPGVNELSEISKYGEQLTLWIMSSIIEPEAHKIRARRLYFWVDIASRCMAHHDYATAHNIYNSISYSSVVRMKETVLGIRQTAKFQYKKLKDFFDDNYQTSFRKTYNDVLPSLPSTAPLIRNIIHAKLQVKPSQLQRQEKMKQDGKTARDHDENLIALIEFKATKEARQVLNKALLQYNFSENEKLQKWIGGRISQYTLSSKKEYTEFYSKLHAISLKREPKREGLEFITPWEFTSSKLDDPLKGNIKQVQFTAMEASEKDQKAIAKRLVTLLENLKKCH